MNKTSTLRGITLDTCRTEPCFATGILPAVMLVLGGGVSLAGPCFG